MGGAFHFEDILQIATSPDVYVDTSYSLITIVNKIGPARFAEYIKALGSEKFIFGSDYVFGLTPEKYGVKKQVDIIIRLPIGEEAKENILHKNAMKLLDYRSIKI